MVRRRPMVPNVTTPREPNSPKAVGADASAPRPAVRHPLAKERRRSNGSADSSTSSPPAGIPRVMLCRLPARRTRATPHQYLNSVLFANLLSLLLFLRCPFFL